VYKLTLIARYLLKRRITHFAVVAVTLCVFIVVVVMTVMTGLIGDFKQKNHAFVGDCIISTPSLVGFPYYEEFLDTLGRTDFVAAAAPVVRNYALVSLMGDDDVRRGVEIMGIDPVLQSRTTNFGQTLIYCGAQPNRAFQPSHDPNTLGCIMGIDMVLLRDAQSRYLYGPVPPRRAITLMCFPLNARGAPALAGTSVAASRTFYYSDYSHTGIARVDGAMIYIPLEQAQLLCMGGTEKRVTAIHVKLRAGVGLRDGRARLAELWQQFQQSKQGAQDRYLLDAVRVQDWKEYRRAFIAPMEKEELLLSLLFLLVGITTVFIVFVVFYMVINSKRKDIGVLKSVGASQGDILVLFSGFACVVGLTGSCAGALLGWLFLAKINGLEHWLYEHFHFQLWDRTIYAIGAIPNRVEPGVVAVIVGGALVSCLVGALAPSYLAARLRPVETLHAGRT
jgi:lipoprotein-releasing system permease protein